MGVRENLIKAKALIDTPEKWGKGWPTPDGTMCIYMATSEAIERDDEEEHDAEETLRAECFKTVGHDRLSHFNDHPDTTHADIMALFDRAIASAE